jgi:hypothetical protein
MRSRGRGVHHEGHEDHEGFLGGGRVGVATE